MKPAVRIAVPLVAVAALVGCAHSPSTAAIVGDKVISEAELTEAVDSCRRINPKIKRLDVLFPLILGELSDEVSPKLGRPIGAARLRAAMEADPDASQTLGTSCQKVVEGELKMRYLQDSAGLEAVLRELPRVEINPRYGTWGSRGINPRGGSISVEAKS